MNEQSPKVSVGLPVYNGANFVADAIRDVLAQTWTDFELIISDNASDDPTQEICEKFAAADPRIRYVRQDKNKGAGWNFNEVVRLSRGEYFKWLAHDDRMAPEFLERCIAVLEAAPSIVVAYPKTTVVDDKGAPIEDYSVRLRTDSDRLTQRFDDLVLAWSLCFEVFGLIRASALRQTGMMGNFGHGDGVLLAQLAMLGTFEEVEAHLHFARRHSRQSIRQFGLSEEGGNDYHRYTVWFNPALAGRLTFPNWKIGWEFYKTIWMFPTDARDRLRCHLTMAVWTRKHARHLLGDLVVAANYLKHRVVGRRAVA
jgi:glycosyltransferase involved in cell wall biosynthesis